MNNKFDELTKAMAQSVTRREAFRKLGAGLVAAVVTAFGIRTVSASNKHRGNCLVLYGTTDQKPYYTGLCISSHDCFAWASPVCSGSVHANRIGNACTSDIDLNTSC